MHEGAIHTLMNAAMHPIWIYCKTYVERLCRGAHVALTSELMGRSQDLSDYILRCFYRRLTMKRAVPPVLFE